MMTPEQSERLLRSMRVLLAEAAQHERVGTCGIADSFGRAAANTLARYLEVERKREALQRSPTISINRELSGMQ